MKKNRGFVCPVITDPEVVKILHMRKEKEGIPFIAQINKAVKKDYLEVKRLIEDGLCTDGAHHKQWYIEEIAKALKLKMELRSGRDYEEGIAP